MADDWFEDDVDEADDVETPSAGSGVRIIGATAATGSVPVTPPPTGRHDAVPPAVPTASPPPINRPPRLPGPGAATPSSFGAVPIIRPDMDPPTGAVEIPPVAPDQSFEMPHYSDPPTGQVPKVVVDEESDGWANLSGQPRWRDEHDDSEAADFSDLLDDAPKLGALDEASDAGAVFFDIPDLTDDRIPTVGPPSREVRAVRVDATSEHAALDAAEAAEPPRQQPGPRRRRPGPAPAGASGQRAARGAATGSESGGAGGRNMPMAISVGVALLALGGACFWLGALATTALIAVVLCVAAIELFSTLNQAGYRPAGLLGIVAVAGLAVAPLSKGYFAYPIVLGVFMLAGLAWFLFVQPGEGAVMNLGVTLLGVLYVGGLGSFGTLALGAARPFETPKLDNAGIGVVVAAVLVAVSYDVGAYFIGRALGHTPLNAASPNKTQEGLFGGVFVGIAVPFLILFLSGWDPVGASASKAFAFCLICAVMAPLGDLCESALKRDLGVKDMGTLLPGHGGVLDRFDALLFVLPTAYFMAHLLGLGSAGGVTGLF